jgi:hypothetical protein
MRLIADQGQDAMPPTDPHHKDSISQPISAYPVHPNMALELTPQCGPKIGCVLKLGNGSHVISIYICGAAQRQAVGRAEVTAPRASCQPYALVIGCFRSGLSGQPQERSERLYRASRLL